MMDKIVDGKKRKLVGVGASKKKLRTDQLDPETQTAMRIINVDRDALFKEEMDKLPKLEENDALIQIHTAYPWTSEVEDKTSTWKYPSTPEETIRYKVYKDLWEKGFYVSSGDKFGGDFLAYPGIRDPHIFKFIKFVRKSRRSVLFIASDVSR